jgi:hypothetical protein
MALSHLFLNLFWVIVNILRATCTICDGQRTLGAGKLTEKVLKLFMATGKDEVISLIEALNIQHHILAPVLPTSKS